MLGATRSLVGYDVVVLSAGDREPGAAVTVDHDAPTHTLLLLRELANERLSRREVLAEDAPQLDLPAPSAPKPPR